MLMFEPLRKYADFNGRASRSEYWLFTLFSVIVLFVAALLENGGNAFTTLVSLALTIPTIALMVRRLHDSDKSGWWSIVTFIPFVGAIPALIFALLPGTQGDNNYGPNPRNN